MVTMFKNTLTRTSLHHQIKFAPAANVLKYQPLCVCINKPFQQRSFRRELCAIVPVKNLYCGLLKLNSNHGTFPIPPLCRTRSNYSSTYTTPTCSTLHLMASKCKLHKGVILHSNGCSQGWHHIRQLSVSRLRFTGDSKHRDTVIHKLQSVENSLRYHGYSTIRIGLVFVFTLGMCLYIFRESIRENISDEVSQVATRSLEDQVVVGKAEQFAKGLLDAIMNDEQMTKLASEFVVEVLMREETKQATARVLLSVIDDPKTREHLILATKQVFLAALYDDDSQTALKVVFKKILADDETRQAAKDLLAFVFAEDDIRNLVAEFFKNVIKMDMVVRQATELGKDVTHSVITDPTIQKETGDSLWRAMGHSITPRWFGGSPSPPPSPSTPSSPSPSETVSPETGEIEATDAKSVEGKPDTVVAIQEKEEQKEIDKNLEELADDFIE